MADPFVRDLAALDERSRHQLRSLAATRAHVLSSPPESSKMRFIKNRPLLAALIVLALVGVASGGVYAVHHAFLSVDPTKSAPEIQHDVESQLANEGVSASVNAEKSDDGEVKLTISSTDMSLPQRLSEMGAIVATPHDGSATGSGAMHRITFDDQAHLDDAQTARLTTAITSKDVITALSSDNTDVKPIIEHALTAAGFTDVDITETNGDFTIKIKSAPAD